MLIGSEDFFFYAMEANTGEVRWKYETGLGYRVLPRQFRGISPSSAARTVFSMHSRLRPDICDGKRRRASWSQRLP